MRRSKGLAGARSSLPNAFLLSLIRNATLLVLAVAAAGCADSIHDRAAAGDIPAVARLYDRDAALLSTRDERGKTPLHMAVTSGSTPMVQWLLEHGADVNAQDKTGLTPLHLAAWWTATERAKVLLDSGANLEARDAFGDTPLHMAAMHGRNAMVRLLIDKGADASARNKDGRTPAELARSKRHGFTASYIEGRMGVR